MVAITMLIEETEIISTTVIPLGISNLALGLITALIFGCILFVVTYGRQCCDNIKWIIEVYKMNYGKKPEETTIKGKVKTEVPIEAIDKEEIAEIKEEISELSQQIKGILAEIKQIRNTEIENALEGIETAPTEYAMKFEIKRIEYDNAMKILQVTLANMPEAAIAYKKKVNDWIDAAEKKFRKYGPENFIKKVQEIKARRGQAG
ncbi:MAG: hypothetical protein JW837_03620 [Sedimentisphaerales bacterium]|nr:hypothetical protein [Sedimentisphaerales bacterium]